MGDTKVKTCTICGKPVFEDRAMCRKHYLEQQNEYEKIRTIREAKIRKALGGLNPINLLEPLVFENGHKLTISWDRQAGQVKWAIEDPDHPADSYAILTDGEQNRKITNYIKRVLRFEKAIGE